MILRQTLLFLCLVVCSGLAYASFTSPSSGISTSGNYTVSWDNTATGNIYSGWYHFRLYEQNLNLGTPPVQLNLPSYSGQSISFTGKADGRYEYRLEVLSCIASGCYYYEPVDNTMIVLVGAEATPIIPPAEGPTAVGSTAYHATVDNKGEAHVSIPIEIPAGVNGMHPEISLSYSSGGQTAKAIHQAAGGLLGFGWNLNGFSSIDRCTVGKPDVSGYISPSNPEWGNQTMRPKLKYDNTDNLCLDGELLVLVSGTHFSDGAQYRTYRESFRLIKLIGSGTNMRFEVRNPNGGTSQYGNSPDSKVQKEIGPSNSTLTPIFKWAIKSETDSFGNSINYSYYKWQYFSFQANKQRIFPTSITYPGGYVNFDYVSLNVPNWLQPNQVEDDGAAAGPDRWRFNSDGSDQLISITTPAKRYNLLGSGQTTGDMREHGLKLSGVQECGVISSGNYSCLPALEFDWLERTTAFPEAPQITDLYYEISYLGSVTDSLGSVTEFEYGKIWGYNSPNDTNKFTEFPVPVPTSGDLTGSSYARRSLNAGSSAGLREIGHVVVSMERNTGVSDQPYVLEYQYRGSGSNSYLGKGFLGFPAIRIEDPQTGYVTYKAFEVDKAGFGPVGLVGDTSAVIVLSGISGQSGSQLFSKEEWRHGVKTLNHPNGAKTYLPITEQHSNFSYENGTFLGGTIKTNEYLTDGSGRFFAQITSRTKTGSVLQSTSFTPQYWGHNAPHAFQTSRVKNEQIDTTILGNVTSLTDWRIGYTTSETHTAHDGAAGSSYVTDSKSRSVNYTLKSGTTKVQTETHFPGDTEYQRQVTYGYDSSGRISSITESGQNIQTRTTLLQDYYRSTPQLTINPLGHEQAIEELDARFEFPTRATNENGLVRMSEYDAFGRLVLLIDEDGVDTTWRYAPCGCSSVPGKYETIYPEYYIEISSPIAPDSREYYDSLSRVVRKQVQGFDGQWINTDIQYDEFGRIYRTSLPYVSGSTAYYETRTYDDLGRMTQIDQPDGGYTTTSYAAVAESGENRLRTRTTQYVLRSNGSAATTHYTDSFTDAGRLDRVVNARGTAAETTTHYKYDALGNVIRSEVNGGSDGTTVSTAAFDHAGNRISVTDPNTGTVTSTYTSLNELGTQTDASNSTKQFKYDKLGRLTERTDAEGTNNWYYDPANAKGMIDYETNNNGFERHYNYAYARLTSIDTTISVPGQSTQNFTESYTRDYFGRMEKTTWPSGFFARNEYNNYGYLESLWYNYPILLIDSQGPFGVEQYRTLANEYTEKTFNPQTGRLSSLRTWQGTTDYQDKSYQWFTNGSLETLTDNLANFKDSYSYDQHDRLTGTTTSLASSGTVQRTQTWQYNRLGNLKSKTSSRSADLQATSYQYGATTNAGPHAVSSVTINGSATQLSYDTNGSVTSYNASGTTQDKHLSYNADNQPLIINSGATSITDTNYTAREEYRYAPDGKWYYKKSAWRESGVLRTAHTFRVGDFETTLYSSPGLGGIVKSEKTRVGPFLYIKNTNSSNTTTIERQYLHLDHLGSVVGVRKVTSSTNLSSMAYEPFGERRSANLLGNASSSETSAVLNNQALIPLEGFTGHEMLDRTGFIHMGGRIYDPRIGRFLSPDPIVQAPSNSQSWNRYSYVFNNPLKYTDPSGYNPVPLEEVIVKGPKCIGKCQRDGFSESFTTHFFQTFQAINSSGTNWVNYDNVAYNTASLQGSLMYSIAKSISENNAMMRQALGVGSKTNQNNIQGVLARSGQNGTGIRGQLSEQEFEKRYGSILRTANIDINQNILEAQTMGLKDWILSVKTGGQWDYKVNKKLLAAGISGSLLDEFGNVHFGIVAAAFGFKLSHTLGGAAYYQVYFQSGGSASNMRNLLKNSNTGGWSDAQARSYTESGGEWGDNPGDSLNIMNGWDYFYDYY